MMTYRMSVLLQTKTPRMIEKANDSGPNLQNKIPEQRTLKT